MKHRIGYNRLGRKTSHRRSLHRNMTTSLFRYERIKTTKAKALAIRRTAEKMITRAKVDSVHNRRTIAKDINDKEIVAKLFSDIGPRYNSRPGGYTRILKLGYRKGDAAEMVLLELVEQDLPEKKKTSKKAKAEKETETKTEAVKPQAEPVEEKVAEEQPEAEAEETAEVAAAEESADTSDNTEEAKEEPAADDAEGEKS